MRPGNY